MMKVPPSPCFIFMVHTAEEGDLYTCLKCGSSHVDIYTFQKKKMQACLDCGYEEEVKN